MLTWKEGDIKNLLEEGHALQSRLSKSYSSGRENPNSLARTFSRLMFQGKINTSLHLLSLKGKCRGVLRVTDRIGDSTHETVLYVLKLKHHPAQPGSPDALIKADADPPVVPPVIFEQITGSSIRSAALCAKQGRIQDSRKGEHRPRAENSKINDIHDLLN